MLWFDLIISFIFMLFIGVIAYKKNMSFKLWGLATFIYPYIITVIFLIILFFFKEREKRLVKYLLGLEFFTILLGYGLWQLSKVVTSI